MIDEALIRKVRRAIGDPHDQCYVASEALYYLAGGKAAGLTPVNGALVIDGERVSHWWLRDETGQVIDLTAEQFDFAWPYEDGRGRGFNVHKKARTMEVMAQVVLG